MEIEIIKADMAAYDTGGGTRQVKTQIEVCRSLHPRQQRRIVIYETSGSCLGYVIAHEQLEDLTDALMDALDQLEPIMETGIPFGDE